MKYSYKIRSVGKEIISEFLEKIKDLREYAVKVKEDALAVRKIAEWLEIEIEDCSKRNFKNKIKAMKSLERGEKDIAKEIIKFIIILDYLMRSMEDEKNELKVKLKRIEKDYIRCMREIDKLLNVKVDDLTSSSINRIFRSIARIFRLMINLETELDRTNRIIILSRALIEEKRRILEEGITGDTVKKILQKIGERNVEEEFGKILVELKSLSP